ncbi:putative patatin-like serine hydrolase [Blumeria hordei DH14]|uniref:Putative patatin-like serine hydrolase n=1 Tax=Blumeria graminis f. sp. hordei (strain DH14) TaxID=546991 RepID=N1JH36_BLUG1|nr:putative patatin-like serine hydrolase [Blumeria hordei DH14]
MSEKPSFSTKNPDEKPPLRILTLDGGGVRGYSMLILIQELMHRTYVEIEGRAPRRDQIPKPADHFDLIVGAGTGGMIALMLGRLRLDIETCKELYIYTTKKVFQTDKTIAGIPYRSTLFKASKLEEAIKECVAAHTVLEREGNDGKERFDAEKQMGYPLTWGASGPKRHSSNGSTSSFSARKSSVDLGKSLASMGLGDPDALLAVTAVYKGTNKGGPPALLRSYDSRKEPSPESDCTLWQASRATAATSFAFKPIQIGQSVFLDEGVGKFNPASAALDEACLNEWPGREVGVFVSLGTGKRPAGSDSNSHMWYEGFMGEFAEARRRLISKIEGCEKTHDYLQREGLSKRGVNVENYFRLNVEIGVGEFGLNEWNRLADISNSTRRHLGKPEVQRMSIKAASKLAKIHRAHLRLSENRNTRNFEGSLSVPDARPNAVELPADSLVVPSSAGSFDLSYKNLSGSPSPRVSSPYIYESKSRHQSLLLEPKIDTSSRHKSLLLESKKGYPSQHSMSRSESFLFSDTGKISIMSNDEMFKSKDNLSTRVEPPPLPPKLFVQNPSYMNRPLPPYPVDDEPPPAVNLARKPDYKISFI